MNQLLFFIRSFCLFADAFCQQGLYAVDVGVLAEGVDQWFSTKTGYPDFEFRLQVKVSGGFYGEVADTLVGNGVVVDFFAGP